MKFNWLKKKKETVLPVETPEVIVLEREMPQLIPSVKNVSEHYTTKRNAFIQSFDEHQQIFEERARIKLMDLECKMADDYYVEKTTCIGGITCHVRDDDAIKLHYVNLRDEYEKAKTIITERKHFAFAQYKRLKETAEEALRLEQTLELQGLRYETMIPTEVLNNIIHPLPLYVFKNIDAEGKFSIDVDDYGYGRSLVDYLGYSGDSSQGFEKRAEAKRICFGKTHLLKNSWNHPTGKTYNIKGTIIFPEAERDVQDCIVAFHQKGYKPYTIAHENAFSVNVKSHTLPDPISAADIGNMTVFIKQYGPFDMEKALVESANEWFKSIHEKCFSLN